MIPAIRRALPLLLVAGVASGAGCGKETQSLVLVELKLAMAGPPVTNLKSATLVASPGPTKTYQLSSLSADAGILLGLSISGGVIGNVSIEATAEPQSGCMGFRGTGDVTIAAAGMSQSVSILMEPVDLCPGDGGIGGTMGAAGTTGVAGTGGATGAAGTGVGGGGGSSGSSGGGGSVGTTGFGGSSGSSGGAGRGGSVGSTGSAGSGGSSGTTGSGGMAGYPSLSVCQSFPYGGTGCSVNSVAISPNGKLIATGGDDAKIKIWNMDGRTLTATGTVLPGFNGYRVVFSPDGTRLAYTSDLTTTTVGVRTYTVSGWVAGLTLQDDGSGNTLRGVAFTPDNQRVVSVNGIGFAGGDVFVHNLGGSAFPVYTRRVANEPYTLAVSPRAASDGSVGVAVGSYYGTTTALSLTASGFATGSKDLPASDMTLTTYTVAFSPDGSLIATGENYGAVQFFAYPPAASPAPIGSAISFAGGDTVNTVAFSPNGLYLAVGGAFGKAQLSIYSVASHAEVDRTVPPADVVSLAFSPSGNAIVGGLDDCTVLVCAN